MMFCLGVVASFVTLFQERLRQATAVMHTEVIFGGVLEPRTSGTSIPLTVWDPRERSPLVILFGSSAF
jgi:hypothetical protein